MVAGDIGESSLTRRTVECWDMLPRENTILAKMITRKRISVIARKVEFAGRSWLINRNVKMCVRD